MKQILAVRNCLYKRVLSLLGARLRMPLGISVGMEALKRRNRHYLKTVAGRFQEVSAGCVLPNGSCFPRNCFVLMAPLFILKWKRLGGFFLPEHLNLFLKPLQNGPGRVVVENHF